MICVPEMFGFWIRSGLGERIAGVGEIDVEPGVLVKAQRTVYEFHLEIHVGVETLLMRFRRYISV